MNAPPVDAPRTESAEEFRVVCAWCGRVTREAPEGSQTTHGICGACITTSGILPVDDVTTLGQDRLDALPFGVVRLDPAGRVTAYNRAEAAIAGTDPAQVVGRLFFTEVAPCTKVREFGGEFLRLVAEGRTGRIELLFVFRTRGGDVAVQIRVLYDAAARVATLLVERVR